jgi:putative NADH-flavin reductase
MKVVVVGAAGKTGRAVVSQAKAAGHAVTAFVHNAGDYDVPDVEVQRSRGRMP